MLKLSSIHDRIPVRVAFLTPRNFATACGKISPGDCEAQYA